MLRFLRVVFILPLTLVVIISCNDQAKYSEATYFTMDKNGDLVRPTNYRSWVYVGTPITPNSLNNGKAAFPDYHVIYIDPISYEHYKETGYWREGTIFVTELVSVGSEVASSGNGYFMGDFIGLAAGIKSSKYFPDEPGNWSYYRFTNQLGETNTYTSKAFATQHCNDCHNTSGADDFVFTQFYPVLRAAKAVGDQVIPENKYSQDLKKPKYQKFL